MKYLFQILRNQKLYQYSYIFSLALILIVFFRWELADKLDFLQPIVELFLFLVVLLVLVGSLISLLLDFKKHRNNSLKVLLVSFITLFIIFYVSPSNLSLKLDFNVKLNEREKVIDMLKSGQLGTDYVGGSYQMIKLPRNYEHLSKGGGEILVKQDKNKLEVTFFTFRGFSDSISGFVYRSDDTSPSTGDIGDLKQIEKLRKRWFWIQTK